LKVKIGEGSRQMCVFSMLNISRIYELERLQYHARVSVIFQAVTVMYVFTEAEKGKKGKANPTTGRVSSQDCETSRLAHFLENWLTDGDQAVSLKRQLAVTLQEESFFLISVRG
jgi:hypothetical protein